MFMIAPLNSFMQIQVYPCKISSYLHMSPYLHSCVLTFATESILAQLRPDFRAKTNHMRNNTDTLEYCTRIKVKLRLYVVSCQDTIVMLHYTNHPPTTTYISIYWMLVNTLFFSHFFFRAKTNLMSCS